MGHILFSQINVIKVHLTYIHKLMLTAGLKGRYG